MLVNVNFVTTILFINLAEEKGDLMRSKDHADC